MELPAPFYWLDSEIAVDLHGARALFTTAATGDLGLLTGDPEVPANRERLARRHGIGLAWRKQVHGHDVHAVSAPTDPEGPWIEADGLATHTTGVAPLVLAADCLPIVISDGRGVAVVHAGWHGLEEGIIAQGVQALAPAGPLSAAIGPSAGACCYEVGDELREKFSAYGAEQGSNLDIKAIARRQLRDAGVSQIHDPGICTICSAPDEFFSHRRDHGDTGRQAGIGWLVGAEHQGAAHLGPETQITLEAGH